MNVTLCHAIHSKLVTKLYYEGEYRTIEPFCYGISKSGSELLRAYQVSGFSKHSEKIPDWRLFTVSKITNMEITGLKFIGNRLGYDRNDSAMAQIFCHV